MADVAIDQELIIKRNIDDGFPDLTDQEKAFAYKMVENGYNHRQAAEEVGISPGNAIRVLRKPLPYLLSLPAETLALHSLQQWPRTDHERHPKANTCGCSLPGRILCFNAQSCSIATCCRIALVPKALSIYCSSKKPRLGKTTVSRFCMIH